MKADYLMDSDAEELNLPSQQQRLNYDQLAMTNQSFDRTSSGAGMQGSPYMNPQMMGYGQPPFPPYGYPPMYLHPGFNPMGMQAPYGVPDIRYAVGPDGQLQMITP